MPNPASWPMVARRRASNSADGCGRPATSSTPRGVGGGSRSKLSSRRVRTAMRALPGRVVATPAQGGRSASKRPSPCATPLLRNAPLGTGALRGRRGEQAGRGPVVEARAADPGSMSPKSPRRQPPRGRASARVHHLRCERLIFQLPGIVRDNGKRITDGVHDAYHGQMWRQASPTVQRVNSAQSLLLVGRAHVDFGRVLSSMCRAF